MRKLYALATGCAPVDIAALIFASASLPILAFHAVRYREERALESIYGVFSGLFAFSAAILVTYGFPGSIILPATFAILSLGSLHAYLREKRTGRAIGALIFITVSIGILLTEVFL